MMEDEDFDPCTSPEYHSLHAHWLIGMHRILLYLSHLQGYLGFHNLISHQINSAERQMLEHLLNVEEERLYLLHTYDSDSQRYEEAIHHLQQHLQHTTHFLWQLKSAGYN